MKRWRWSPAQQAHWGNGSYWEGDMTGGGTGSGVPFDDYVQGYSGSGETEADLGDGSGTGNFDDPSLVAIVWR